MLKEIFHDSFENFGTVHWQYRYCKEGVVYFFVCVVYRRVIQERCIISHFRLMAHLQQHGNNRKTTETFRLEDENDYEYEISLKSFFRVFSKIETPESFVVLFFTHKDRYLY